MAYTIEQIEYLYEMGMMPDWVYYQVNGKSAQENYNDIHMKLCKEAREAARHNWKGFEKECEEKATAAVNEALEKIFDGFKL